jgi:hypothetical protein
MRHPPIASFHFHLFAGAALAGAVACGDEPAERNPIGGSCEEPAPIVLDAAGNETILGELPGRTLSSTASCDNAEEVTVAFSFVLPEPRAVAAAVTSVFPMQVALSEDCDSVDPVCRSIVQSQLEAGTHRVLVSGPPFAEFGLVLTSTVGSEPMDPMIPIPDPDPDPDRLPPDAPGSCQTPVPIALEPGETTDLVLDWRAPQVLERELCRSSNDRPARTFLVTSSQPWSLGAVATNGLRVELLDTGCDTRPLCPNCCAVLSSSQPDGWFVPRLEPGSVRLRFFPTGQQESVVRLTAGAPIPRPPNDRCATATAVPLDEPRDIVVPFGSVELDPFVQCRARTLYHAFDLPPDTRVSVTQLEGSLWFSLLDDSCRPVGGLQCDFGSRCLDQDGPLPPGRYVLETSSEDRVDGLFRLSGEPRPAPPPNDRCEDATRLDLADGFVSTAVNLAGARNEGAFELSLPQGADAWFRVVVPERSDVDVSSFIHQIRIHDTDDCSSVSLNSQRSSSRIYSFGPGEFLARVSTSNVGCSESQDRSVTLSATPTPPAPPNDDCTQPTDIELNGGLARITGTLHGASDDYGARSCPSFVESTEGPDVVYRLTLDEPRRLRIERLASGNVDVSLHTECAAVRALACTEFRSEPLNDEGVLLSAGTYFLRLDVEDDDFFSVPPQSYDLLLIADRTP